jgi:hypothetical protein
MHPAIAKTGLLLPPRTRPIPSPTSQFIHLDLISRLSICASLLRRTSCALLKNIVFVNSILLVLLCAGLATM